MGQANADASQIDPKTNAFKFSGDFESGAQPNRKEFDALEKEVYVDNINRINAKYRGKVPLEWEDVHGGVEVAQEDLCG